MNEQQNEPRRRLTHAEVREALKRPAPTPAVPTRQA
jgi:hypothetical protein